jgi:hypothetical protein
VFAGLDSWNEGHLHRVDRTSRVEDIFMEQTRLQKRRIKVGSYFPFHKSVSFQIRIGKISCLYLHLSQILRKKYKEINFSKRG